MLNRLLLLLVLFLPVPALADTAISLFQSYAGNVSFVGIQKTIRTASNSGDFCAVAGPGTDVTATLSDLPSGATVLSAHLYWAGSGSTPDNTVNFEGVSRTALASRRYTSATVGYNFFGAGVDVTDVVKAKGNGTYTFSGLTVDSTSTFCSVEGVLGGFSLLVIYSHPDETFRVLNLYEGFRYVRYSSVTLTLSNFKVPSPVGTATGKVGHVTWEGDSSLGSNGETLTFNGVELYDGSNPSQNQFNSVSSINGDGSSHGIDFDAYTVNSQLTPGMTTVDTVYSSGQDLVLLHAEVIAVPNVPVADTEITMSLLDSTVTLGQQNAFVMTVKNNGPNDETGTLTVSQTLNSALTINTVSGVGWTCTTSTQTVTCTRPGTHVSGVTLPLIYIYFTPKSVPGAAFTHTTTLSKTGTIFDNVSTNNSASLSITVATPGWVFTDKACTHDVAFGTTNQCVVYNWQSATRIAGTSITGIWLTRLVSGKPTRFHPAQGTTVSVGWGLSCHNPKTTGGVKATFTALASPQELATCTADGNTPASFTYNNITFAGGSPSSPVGYTLNYKDVGTVELFFTSSQGSGSSGPFTFRPNAIVLSNIVTTPGGVPNPVPTSASSSRFAKAGETFSLKLTAVTSNVPAVATPNFGKEISPETFSLTVAKGATSPGNVEYADMTQLPALGGSFGAISGGAATGNSFTFGEVGIIKLTPGLTSGNYLGAGVPTTVSTNVGRFYPDRFETDAVPSITTCLTNMGCTSGYGAVYSGQAFEVRVNAADASGNQLQNYHGVFAKPITLTAWSAGGGTGTQNPNSTNGLRLSTNVTPVNALASAFTTGKTSAINVMYPLTTTFSSATPRNPSPNWTSPTTIYLRAVEQAGNDGVTSVSASEYPMRVLNGRLEVPSFNNSEVVKTPLRLQAQYWTGSRWELNSNDSTSVIVPVAANLGFSNCTWLVVALGCTSPLTPTSTANLTFSSGIAVLRFNAAGAVGRAQLKVNSPSHLPSTNGQLVFGVYRPTVDYIREVY